MIMNGTFLGNYQERKSYTSAIAAIVSDWKNVAWKVQTVNSWTYWIYG